VAEVKDSMDFLSEDDEKLLAQIEYIKKNILNYIKPEVMVDKIRQIIEESSLFSFKSKRNSKYINVYKPLFILSMDKELAIKQRQYSFIYQDGETVDNRHELMPDYDFINLCLQDEITSKYSEFLLRQLTDNNEFMKILNEQNIDGKKISKKQLKLVSFVTASIFGITVELRQNIIYLEYVI
jgi:hypothetical protein